MNERMPIVAWMTSAIASIAQLSAGAIAFFAFVTDTCAYCVMRPIKIGFTCLARLYLPARHGRTPHSRVSFPILARFTKAEHDVTKSGRRREVPAQQSGRRGARPARIEELEARVRNVGLESL